MGIRTFREEPAVRAAGRNISEYLGHRYSGRSHDEAFQLASVEKKPDAESNQASEPDESDGSEEDPIMGWPRADQL